MAGVSVAMTRGEWREDEDEDKDVELSKNEA
jgi:hypothetical protein